MVTHDVDEALFLSDRVAMMTSGPRARAGRHPEVPFPRPRDRAAVMEHPRYYELREELIGFLNSQSHEQDQEQRAEKVQSSPYRRASGAIAIARVGRSRRFPLARPRRMLATMHVRGSDVNRPAARPC